MTPACYVVVVYCAAEYSREVRNRMLPYNGGEAVWLRIVDVHCKAAIAICYAEDRSTVMIYFALHGPKQMSKR